MSEISSSEVGGQDVFRLCYSRPILLGDEDDTNWRHGKGRREVLQLQASGALEYIQNYQIRALERVSRASIPPESAKKILVGMRDQCSRYLAKRVPNPPGNFFEIEMKYCVGPDMEKINIEKYLNSEPSQDFDWMEKLGELWGEAFKCAGWPPPIFTDQRQQRELLAGRRTDHVVLAEQGHRLYLDVTGQLNYGSPRTRMGASSFRIDPARAQRLIGAFQSLPSMPPASPNPASLIVHCQKGGTITDNVWPWDADRRPMVPALTELNEIFDKVPKMPGVDTAIPKYNLDPGVVWVLIIVASDSHGGRP